MTNENRVTRMKLHSTEEGAHFFAHLEILGLENARKEGAFDRLKEKVDGFVEVCVTTIEEKRAALQDEFGFGIGYKIDSGSIYVWTQNDYRLYQFDDLLQIVDALLVSGFKRSFPLRGTIGYGHLKFERIGRTDEVQTISLFDSEELDRMAWCEAEELKSPMDLSGAVLTQKAWKEVKRQFEKGKNEGWGSVMRSAGIDSFGYLLNRYLLFCDIPFEDGSRGKHLAFNWNYNSHEGLSEDIICKAFDGPCVTFAGNPVKRENTREFLGATRRGVEFHSLSRNASSTVIKAVAESDLLGAGETQHSGNRFVAAWPVQNPSHEASRQRSASASVGKSCKLEDLLIIKERDDR